MSSLKLRFSRSKLDTTKRKSAGKTMMGKTAHVERLNRQYRKALLKRVKVGSRMVTSNKAKLCRFNLCYCSANKRVMEALGIPWPNITTISELILFAKFVQKNAERILGDEVKVFENPIVGRCIFTVNLDPESYPEIRKKILLNEWVLIGLNSWLPYKERLRVVNDLLNGRMRRIVAYNKDDPVPIKVLIPLELHYNICLSSVLFEHYAGIFGITALAYMLGY